MLCTTPSRLTRRSGAPNGRPAGGRLGFAGRDGQAVDEARLEVALAVENLDWAARNAAKVLGRRGARAVVGGLESVRPPFVEPVVLADVPEDAPAVTEETFGPLLVANTVPDMDEAVRLANATSYGLGATVFSASRGEQVAARLRCGMVAVNGAITSAGVPALPFGGVGASGFGRIHGADGLREFARAQAVASQRWRQPLAVLTFDRTRRATWTLLRVVRLVHGRR